MNQDITVVMNQKRSRFVRAEVVVCIDTADELVFALNCNAGICRSESSREESVWERTMRPSILYDISS